MNLPVFNVSAFAASGSSELRALNTSFATLTFGADRKIIRANNSLLNLFRLEPDRIYGETETVLLFPSDHHDIASVWADLEKGMEVMRSGRHRRGDGDAIWLHSIYTPLLDSEGRLTEVVKISTDITEFEAQKADDRGQIEAINRTQAVVQFALDGTILSANARFLEIVGFDKDEVVGRHHRMFVDADEASSETYKQLWAGLRAGHAASGEFHRRTNSGGDVWLQATYSPIFDLNGRPFKIVKYASDVTQEKLRTADYESQVYAIDRSNCVVTFDMHGTILDANSRFLEATGYALEDIVGRHHRMFVDDAHAHSIEYASFWSDLRAGKYQAGQYRRIGRNGSELWFQATYNPVLDWSGRPIKVIKYASEVTEQKARQVEHQGQIAAIHKSLCVISFDLDGTIIDANDRFLDAFGYRFNEVRGKHHSMFVEDDCKTSSTYRDFWAKLARGEFQAGEYKRCSKTGRDVWLQATYNPIFDPNGRPVRVVKYATDITEQKMRGTDLEGQIRAINRSQGVVTFALDGTILEINDNFLDILGLDRQAILGRHHSTLVDVETRTSPEYQNFWRELAEGNYKSGLFKRVGRDGRVIWIQASYNPILDLDGRPTKVIKFASDVTSNVELAEAYAEAKRQAQHDSATALPNRIRLSHFLATHLAHPGQKLVAFYIDLDRFKPVNDKHGHHIGDKVLGEIADRLRRLLKNDQIVARVGGDEFVIAAPDLEEDEIEPFCQKIIAAISSPIQIDSLEITIGASVGVSLAPADATSPDELLRCADAALYRAKHGGRGAFSVFSKDLNDRLSGQRRMIEEMRRGLSAGEFFLEYQPRFDTKSRMPRSAEALLRWAHPEKGRVNPLDFIPLAERSGLITRLGEWVMMTACEAARNWSGIGVSVNVSPVQFREGNLVSVVERALSSSGLSPHQLEIEVTESVLLGDPDQCRAMFADLKRLGVRLAIDDFGTGYSSLGYLKSFPFDVIKIDKSFISSNDDGSSNTEIVRAIIGLAQALGLSVTAEGVETPEQFSALLEHRCEEVQGFLLARPMPLERFLAWKKDVPSFIR